MGSEFEMEFNEVSFEYGGRPSGLPHQQQARRPAGQYEVERPTGQFAVERPTGQFAVESPTGQVEVEGPTGHFEVDRPTGQYAVERPTGQFGIVRPTGQQEVERPTGQQEVGRPTGQFEFKQVPVKTSGYQVTHALGWGSPRGWGKLLSSRDLMSLIFPPAQARKPPLFPVSLEALGEEEVSCAAWMIPCVKQQNRGGLTNKRTRRAPSTPVPFRWCLAPLLTLF